MADPWLKFYAADWRSDPRLKMCSAAARGVWIEMICLMHEATPYGHLLIHGQPPNEAQLASLTGIPHAELPDLVAELERMGVFSRTKEGVIYSRKLVRMASRSAVARKNGKKGGNPSLCNGTDIPPQVNPRDKGSHKTQKPEARGQKIGSSEPINARAVLREVVSSETADAFIAMRKAIRAPLTAKAAQLIAGDLRGRADADEVMLKSVKNSWRGVFPPDKTSPLPGGSNVQPYRDRRQEAANEAHRNLIATVARARPASGGDWFDG